MNTQNVVMLDNTVILDANGFISLNAAPSPIAETGNDPTVINGNQNAQANQTATQQPVAEQQPQEQGFNFWNIIIMYAVVIAAAYFFWIRPQKKREKSIKEMQAAIKAGDNVITSSGFYGKIVSVGEDCFVVEFGTNKGVRVPVNKTDILAVREPKLGSSKETETSAQ